MCLEKLDEVFGTGKKQSLLSFRIPLQVTEGYKVFCRHFESLYSFVGKDIPFPIGVWVHEKDWREHPIMDLIFTPKLIDDEGNRYPYGFHVFVNNRVGRRKVLVRNIVASGQQWGEQVVVCKEMFICKE